MYIAEHVVSGIATVGPGRACALPKFCANIDASNFAGTRTHCAMRRRAARVRYIYERAAS